MLILNEEMDCCFRLEDNFLIDVNESRKGTWVVRMLALSGTKHRFEYWLKECDRKEEAQKVFNHVVLALRDKKEVLVI